MCGVCEARGQGSPTPNTGGRGRGRHTAGAEKWPVPRPSDAPATAPGDSRAARRSSVQDSARLQDEVASPTREVPE